ncbi:MAG: hypothetical protein R2752_09265 [Vicinamibacterales bacterium]
MALPFRSIAVPAGPRAALVALIVPILAMGCARAATGVAVTLVPADADAPARVRVTGLSPDGLRALPDQAADPAAWEAVLRVTVAGTPDGQPAVAGRYAVDGAALEFRPAFPFDPGRAYDARVDPAALPGASAGASAGGAIVRAALSLPAPAATPATTVTRVYPSGDEWPENLLRLYVEFSGPMSRAGGFDHVRLLDEDGRAVVDPFLPLDVDLWNSDYTRFTLFLDPGRVKTGILPNEQMGRPLQAGRTYTIEVATSWPDALGRPLAAPYRRTVRVVAADDQPVTPADWRIEPPAAGTRDALVVRFPAALDHGLLQRAVAVERAGAADRLPGTIAIDPGEAVWRFIPDAPWTASAYDLVVYAILEDPSGNRVGRKFEVDRFDEVDRAPTPERTTLAFRVSPPA